MRLSEVDTSPVTPSSSDGDTRDFGSAGPREWETSGFICQSHSISGSVSCCLSNPHRRNEISDNDQRSCRAISHPRDRATSDMSNVDLVLLTRNFSLRLLSGLTRSPAAGGPQSGTRCEALQLLFGFQWQNDQRYRLPICQLFASVVRGVCRRTGAKMRRLYHGVRRYRHTFRSISLIPVLTCTL